MLQWMQSVARALLGLLAACLADGSIGTPVSQLNWGEKKKTKQCNMSNEVVKKAQHLCHHFFTRRSTRFIKHALPACDMFRN